MPPPIRPRCPAPCTSTSASAARLRGWCGSAPGRSAPSPNEDRWEFRDAGGWERDRSADSLRRVVRLVPERELPRACEGHLVVPASLDDRGRDSLQRWRFSTYGEFRLAAAACGWSREPCPTGPLIVRFSTPVRGAVVQRHLRLTPATTFTVSDTAEERDQWPLEAELAPRTWYGVVADSGLRDVFGQRLSGNPVATARTSSYAPAVNYAWGRAVVERKGPRTLAVTHVNVDTLEVLVAPVPDSLERELMARSEWQWAELWPALLRGAERRRIAVTGTPDRVGLFGVPLPAPPAGRRGPTLLAVQVTSSRLDSVSRRNRPIALLQVTDLGAHARVGATEGAVWVTGASDGLPRPGAAVTLHDPSGAVLAASKSGADGVARFAGSARRPPEAPTRRSTAGPRDTSPWRTAATGPSSALNRYDPDLSPWRFNVSAAWGSDRLPVAAAVFTERGIYRPGDTVYAKSIVRTGPLGALTRPHAGRLAPMGVRPERSGRRARRLQEKTVALSAFGTARRRSSACRRRLGTTRWRELRRAGAGPRSRARRTEWPSTGLRSSWWTSLPTPARASPAIRSCHGRGAISVRRADGPGGGELGAAPAERWRRAQRSRAPTTTSSATGDGGGRIWTARPHRCR